MVEFLVGLGALIVIAVSWFVKHLQKKVKKQAVDIKRLENEKVIDAAKSEALEEAVIVDKELEEKLVKNVKEIMEAESVEEIIGAINDDIAQWLSDTDNDTNK